MIQKPPCVAWGGASTTSPPLSPSLRLLWWLDVIADGWRPNRRIREIRQRGAEAGATFFGVYVWEYVYGITVALRSGVGAARAVLRTAYEAAEAQRQSDVLSSREDTAIRLARVLAAKEQAAGNYIVTIADFEEVADKIRAMPKLETDATLSPAALAALNEVMRQGHEAVVAHFTRPAYDGLTIHLAERLPAGTWHRGKPRF